MYALRTNNMYINYICSYIVTTRLVVKVGCSLGFLPEMDYVSLGHQPRIINHPS